MKNFIKKILREYDLPNSPAQRFYDYLLSKGYLNENSEVTMSIDTLYIYSLPYPAPEEFFTKHDGTIIILVPYLFEDEGMIKIIFHEESFYDSTEAINDIKDYIATSWDMDFPVDFDDDDYVFDN
jgi:hypothetical protein